MSFDPFKVNLNKYEEKWAERRRFISKWSLIIAMAITCFWTVWQIVSGYELLNNFKIFSYHFIFGAPRIWTDWLMVPILIVMAMVVLHFFKKDKFEFWQTDKKDIKSDDESGSKWAYVKALAWSLFPGCLAAVGGLMFMLISAKGSSGEIFGAIIGSLLLGAFSALAIGKDLDIRYGNHMVFVIGSALTIAAFSFIDAGIGLCLGLGATFGIYLLVEDHDMTSHRRFLSSLLFGLSFIIFYSLILGLIACIGAIMIFTIAFSFSYLLKYLFSMEFWVENGVMEK